MSGPPLARTEKRERRPESDGDERRLWADFKKTGDESAKQRLVERYLPQVKYAADRLASRLPAHADVEDLAQTGVFGLMEAIERFDPSKGVKFETYCQQRITGSMLDGIRAADWVPRLVRATAQRVEKAWLDLEGELGREPSDFEMAERLGLELEEYDKLLQDANVTSMISYHLTSPSEDGTARQKLESIEDRGRSSPVDEAQRREIMETLAKVLSKKERLVIILYYYERFTFKEIGEVLDVTESRVCQIHSKVIAKLKAKLARAQTDLLAD